MTDCEIAAIAFLIGLGLTCIALIEWDAYLKRREVKRLRIVWRMNS